MDEVTLVFAVLGLVLAVASLVWQFASFQLSGPRVRVRLREGLRDLQGVLIGPPAMYPNAVGEHVLAVEVVNSGRLPATVRR